MSSPLADVWEAAAASPFQPTIGKNSQFSIGFVLLFACMCRVVELYVAVAADVLTRLQPCS
mgnify:CR=1 FL=1